jgi:hypothetical protein
MLVEVTQPQALCQSLMDFRSDEFGLLEFNPHAWKFQVLWVAQHRHSSSLANQGFLV